MSYRQYLGTYTQIQTRSWSKITLRGKYELYDKLDMPQRNYLDRYPDWQYWRDEFRRDQYHIYLKESIGERNLMLAQLLFAQTTPSHTPVTDDPAWWDNKF